MTESLDLFLVEDDDNIALLMRKHLERAGHRVSTCRTAADAIIVLGHSSFNMVILDHRLPDMSGLDLLRVLKRDEITTPVLMVTGYGDEQLATQVLQEGALDYIVKDPGLTFLAELPKRVRESFSRHRLQDTNNLLIQALESTSDGLLITNLHGEIMHVNRALEELLGYDRTELLGRQPRMFKSDVHPPQFYANMWQTILARKSWQGELINRCKDGTLLDMSVTISPVFGGHRQLTHFVGIYRDIRERKQLEKQLLQAQKMQSVGTLAGGIAHEFNNLLAGIQGYAALGSREELIDEAAREFFQNIIELTDRAAGLTRQLLAFARKPALSRQPTRMDKLLNSTLELVKHTVCMEVELDLSQFTADAPPTALADANQLQQVLVNLALNARDATQARQDAAADVVDDDLPVPIVFRLRRAQLRRELITFPENIPPGDYLVLEVEDKGTGMSQEVLTQAFDPFYTTKGVGQGTGLGLPVAFGIVRGHQGYLSVDTKFDEGTCIGIYLPRLKKTEETSSITDTDRGAILEPENVIGRNILVVDDERAVLDVVRRFLEIAGHQVTCVTSGKEALELLQAGRPIDLVILDLMIPHEEGTRNFETIQEAMPGLPVLICTGLLQPESPFNELVQDAAGVLRKPFRMNELWYAVNQVFLPESDETADSANAASGAD